MDLVAYPVYALFGGGRWVYWNTDISLFLRKFSTPLHLLYVQSDSLCFHRMRCFCLGGIHSGTVAILIRLVRAYEGGGCDVTVLLWHKDKPKASVLLVAKSAIN